MKKDYTILCDVDDVVADLIGEWLRRYNIDYDDNMSAQDIKCWGIHKYVKPECGAKIFDYLHDERSATLYNCVEPIKGALEGVTRLREAGFRVAFVTSANIHQMAPKAKWLARHGFIDLQYGTTSADYVTAHDKSLLSPGFALIDDGVHNLRGFEGHRILYSQPHNEATTIDFDHRRVRNWVDAVGYFSQSYSRLSHSR